MALHSTQSRGGGFSLESLRLPLVALGIFGVVAGVVAWLILGEFSLVPRILVAGGVLMLGMYVALDPEDVWAKLTGRGAIYSGNTVLIAVAALIILGLFNVLGSRYVTKIDLTANQQFTLSDQSIKVAQALPAPVKVTGWLNANDSRKADFQTLLNDYANRSGGKITYEFIDPVTRPGDARAAGITAIGTITYVMGDKKQDSTGTTEKDISTALVKLERPMKKVYFTTGHGESALDGTGPQDYSAIKAALERDNFTTAPINLLTARTVPDDASELVIGGPTNPFLPEELDTLRAYMQGGGKLIAVVGPTSKTDLSSLLQPYGVAFTGNVVFDPAQSVQQDPRGIVITGYGTHAITQDLRDLTFFPFSTNITYPAAGQGGATAVALAQSSDTSWADPNPQQPQKQPSDATGPLAVAVAVDAGAASSSPTSGTTSSSTTNAARVVLFGSPDLISNNSLGQVLGNQTLFLNAVNWVAQQDNLIDVRAPDTTPRTLVLTGQQMTMIGVSSAALLPLAVLAAGAAIWWTRR